MAKKLILVRESTPKCPTCKYYLKRSLPLASSSDYYCIECGAEYNRVKK